MTRLAKSLIAGTALALLPLTLAYADSSTSVPDASQILNGQVDVSSSISKLNVTGGNIGGDAGVQGTAAGNAVDITTMNDTYVTNEQYTKAVDIGSTVNSNLSNMGGSVGVTSQAMCNSASISTDPSTTQIYSNQECNAVDPYSTVNASATNVAGDVSISGTALGNAFEEDTNAPNAPIETHQLNNSNVNSVVNTNIANVGGSIGATSAAIGNNAQIVHYSTSP